MSQLRRYEILVPLRYNDGRTVPSELLMRTFRELRDRFGAASWETQVVKGIWESAGSAYEDNLTRYFVDVIDTAENRSFVVGFKAILKLRFEQLDDLDHLPSAGRNLAPSRLRHVRQNEHSHFAAPYGAFQ